MKLRSLPFTFHLSSFTFHFSTFHLFASDFNSDRIREESKPTLQEIAELLRKHVDWDLAIEGHTDSIGSDAANLDLSRRRAAAVKNVLTSNHGIDASRLSTGGHGEARPRDRNDTLEGRARNRRVELVRTTH